MNKPKYKIGDKVLVLEDTAFGIRINFEIIDVINVHNDFIEYNFEGWTQEGESEEHVFSNFEDAIPKIKELLL